MAEVAPGDSWWVCPLCNLELDVASAANHVRTLDDHEVLRYR